ncbi:MAG: hypothetical protein ACRDTF_04720 [Pseudonocardiaceae bacterium]
MLDNTILSPVTRETAGLVLSTLAAPQATLMVVRSRDPAAPLGEAAEIANRFGERIGSVSSVRPTRSGSATGRRWSASGGSKRRWNSAKSMMRFDH